MIYGLCLILYVSLAALIVVQARRSATGLVLAVACVLTALWALAGLSDSLTPSPAALGFVDLIRELAWCYFLLHLYRSTSPARAMARRLLITLGCLCLAGIGVSALLDQAGSLTLLTGLPPLRIALAVSQLLMLENLYRNAREQLRWHISLLCIGLGALSGYDVVVYADAVLFHLISPALSEGRVVVTILAAPLLALAAARNREWRIDLHVSRAAAFHSATFLVSGVFLLAMAATGEVIRRFGLPLGSRWEGVAEISLLFAGFVTIAVMLTSASARSILRSLVLDHFFTHRFDYRLEWLRCIDTLSGLAGDHSGAANTRPEDLLATRAIRAIAQVVDSPGGVLLLREPGALSWQWAASWRLPVLSAPVLREHPLCNLLDGTVAAFPLPAEVARLPPLDGLGKTWLAIPLRFGGGTAAELAGCILTAPPRAPFQLDDEVSGLLRVLAREVATHLAEQRATQVLNETRDVRDFAQRFAFVAHDIKNVSGQLSLLLSNADLHLANPAFQADMLTTIRASVSKIGNLIHRLQPGSDGSAIAEVMLTSRLRALADAIGAAHGVPIDLEHDASVESVGMDPAILDGVVTHLLTNAVEGNQVTRSPVSARLRVHRIGDRVAIDVVDTGPGMTPFFIRDHLFRPFHTSKPRGAGIGAFQVRELLRAAGGELIVMSRPGEGTIMRALLPASQELDPALGIADPHVMPLSSVAA